MVVLLFGSALTWISGYFLKKSYFYKPIFLVNHFPKDSHFDYLIAGSSRGLTTVDTEEVDQLLGLKGINLSMDDTGLPSQILMIKHFFESGHSASFSVLTLDYGHFEKSEERLNDNDYRFVSYSDRPYVREYFKKNEKGIIRPLTLSKILPVFAFSYYNLELFWTGLFTMIKPRYTNRFDINGNYSYPDLAFGFEESMKTTMKKNLKSLKNPLLSELESYLAGKGSKLIIYIAPYYNSSTELGNVGNFTVIDHSGVLPSPDFFFDRDHVNSKGKKKATVLFTESFRGIVNTFEP